MLNLGPKSRAWLEAVGLLTLADLKRVGAVPAYLEVLRSGVNANILLLYALEGAITGRHWLEVRREQGRELRAALEA